MTGGAPGCGILRAMERPLYHAARAIAGRLEAHFAADRGGTRASRAPRGPTRPSSSRWWTLPSGRACRGRRGTRPRSRSSSFRRTTPSTRCGSPRHCASDRVPSRAWPRPWSGRASTWGSGATRRGLAVWGTTREVPRFCFVVEVIGPGLLVVKQRLREDSAKFHNVAVLEGDEIKLLAAPGPEVTEHSPLLMTLVDPELSDSTEQADDVLLRLAVSMRAHKRGGLLLIVPAGSDAVARVDPRSRSPTPCPRRSASSPTSCARRRRRGRPSRGTRRSATPSTPSPASPPSTAPP